MAFLTKESSGGAKKDEANGWLFSLSGVSAEWRHNIRPLGNLLKKSSFANLTKPQIAPENEVKHTL